MCDVLIGITRFNAVTCRSVTLSFKHLGLLLLFTSERYDNNSYYNFIINHAFPCRALWSHLKTSSIKYEWPLLTTKYHGWSSNTTFDHDIPCLTTNYHGWPSTNMVILQLRSIFDLVWQWSNEHGHLWWWCHLSKHARLLSMTVDHGHVTMVVDHWPW